MPEAKFNQKQGDIPVSIYFHGATNGINEAGIYVPVSAPALANIRVVNGELLVWSDSQIKSIEIYSATGVKICKTISNVPIALGGYAPGLYLVNIDLENGITETHKVLVGK